VLIDWCLCAWRGGANKQASDKPTPCLAFTYTTQQKAASLVNQHLPEEKRYVRGAVEQVGYGLERFLFLKVRRGVAWRGVESCTCFVCLLCMSEWHDRHCLSPGTA